MTANNQSNYISLGNFTYVERVSGIDDNTLTNFARTVIDQKNMKEKDLGMTIVANLLTAVVLTLIHKYVMEASPFFGTIVSICVSYCLVDGVRSKSNDLQIATTFQTAKINGYKSTVVKFMT